MTARIHHADLWGSRDRKYDWLNTHDVADTQWETVEPKKTYYLFIPQNTRRLSEYDQFWKITDVVPLNGTGVITKRDFLSIDIDADVLWDRVCSFGKLSEHEARAQFKLPKDVRDWQFDWAQKDVRDSGPSREYIKNILYRPFDLQNIYYTGQTRGFIGWPVTKVMRHMLAGENLGLIFMRQVALHDNYTHFGVTRVIVDNRAFYSNKGVMSLAPLYLYPEPGKMLESSPWPEGKDRRRPNLSPEFVEAFAGKLGLKFIPDGQGDMKKTFGPEDVFHYAYAIFHSPTYRGRYAEFLKIDFPRLPLTSDKAVFARLVELGRELVGLHLLERVPRPQATYSQSGDNVVKRTGKNAYKPPGISNLKSGISNLKSEIPNPKFDISNLKSQIPPSPGRVYINDSQYFENVPPEVWDFHVGGYQVCEKWLKDRKDRTLSYDDIEHYRKMTEAVRQTLRLMNEIDQAIPSWPLE